MLRLVSLPDGVPGRLFLSAMPGRYGPFEDEAELIAEMGVEAVICLAPLEEIAEKAPAYAAAARAEGLPWPWRHFPVEDYGVPDNREALLRLAQDIAGQLRAGQSVLIHCAAGIGRTGMLAVLVLMALGLGRRAALSSAASAGGQPEAAAQRDLILWAEGALNRSG